MSAMWDVQKAIYTALTTNSTLMTLVSNRVYDEAPTNQQYPYIIIGDMQEISDNRLNLPGYEIMANVNIYTQVDGLGFYTSKKILEQVNVSLNIKKLNLSNFVCVICKIDNTYTDRESDKRVISARYQIIVHSNTEITF